MEIKDVRQLVERYYSLSSSVEKVEVPKRRYKRPDLQALSIRWYGVNLISYKVRYEFAPISDGGKK